MEGRLQNGMAEVHNVPKDTEKYWVVRLIQNQLWFYGSWDNKPQANEICKLLDGVVIERMD